MGRHSKAVKLVGGVRGGLALLDDDERRGDEAVRAGGDGGVEASAVGGHGIAPGERDIDDGVGFFAARLGLARR